VSLLKYSSTVEPVNEGRATNRRGFRHPLRLGLIGRGGTAQRVAVIAEQSGFEIAARLPSPERLTPNGTSPAVDAYVVSSRAFGPAEGRSLRLLSNRLPGLPILVVSGYDGRAIREALAAGASGFVSFDRLDEQLPPAVEAVCSGQLAIPMEFRGALAKPRLSPREKQVMAMVVMGFTNREIANKLFLAETTIKSHLSSSFGKMGVRSRHEATTLILDSSSGFGPGILAISENVEAATRS